LAGIFGSGVKAGLAGCSGFAPIIDLFL